MTYDGILHAHSRYSYDGKLSLAELRSLLLARGISFACMTEHTDHLTEESFSNFLNECRSLSDETFLFVPGLEVSFPRAHVIASGISAIVNPQDDPYSLVKALKQQGSIIVFAHPHRSHFQAPEGVGELLDGVEVWNSQYDGKRVPRTASLEMLAENRKQFPNQSAFAGIDFHRVSHEGGPRIRIESDILDQASVIDALRNHRYTLASEWVTVDPDGTIHGVSPAEAKRMSATAVRNIEISKRASSLAKKLNIRAPKWLVSRLRRAL